ncbi:mannosyl-glyco endo-beta-N-acetylglucosaminidase [Labeo rohita]|nr:mannosyl-glyco endo-beta-N-acetylglucosaminidase [Labeo rohita]
MSDDYIFPEWERMGQNCYRWYIFCAQDKYSGRDFYALQLKKTISIQGIVYEFKGDFRASKDPALLKQFQDAKINGNCSSEFQGTSAYSWSRDGKPPAHPYFIVAQLYWPHFVRDLNYLLVQNKHLVTDQEALTVLYDEIPTLKTQKDEEENDPTFKTYTWFLNKPEDAVNDFPELKDYSEGQNFSDDYLRPSTEPLQTDGFTYEWSREEHESTHKDFTLIFRARPTCERVPQVITEEKRIRFDYWQYVKEFVFFGGSHREGAVLAPDPAWIDQAHRNGVAIFGTVFLPPLAFGGDVKDMEELAKPENLQKLVDIAHQLNFEGWFLNTESQKDYSEPLLTTLKLAIQEIDLRGKEMIWYLPSCKQSNIFDPKSKGVRMTCDDKINNTAPAFLEEEGKKLYLNFYHLTQTVFSESRRVNQAPRDYLMFVDEPYWTNTLKNRGYLVDPGRFYHAQNCLWQFFLGENGLERKPTDLYPWYGIAKYAKQRKQLGKD